jgi:hypothetical protein
LEKRNNGYKGVERLPGRRRRSDIEFVATQKGKRRKSIVELSSREMKTSK